MMTDRLPAIIAIRADPRHPGRVVVTLSDRVRLTVAASTAMGLAVGQEMPPTALAPLIEEDARHRGLQDALHLLAVRPRSRAEVARKLAARGISGGNVRRILDRLSHDGYIDDHAFARQWVSHRSRLNPKGRFALRMELRQKGLDDEAIEQALDSVDDNESALVCLEKKYRRQALPWDDRRKRNAMNFLRRRGFPSDVAYDCLRRFIASERSGLAGD